MSFDLRKEEEEKKDPVQTAVQMGKQTPVGQSLPTHVRKNVELESLNVDNVTASAAQSQQDKAQGKQPSVKDQFFEAITFFLPTIVGGVVGGALEGSAGAFQGSKIGMEAGKQYRDYQLAQQRQQPDALEAQRLQISKSNLELRKQEIKEQLKRTENLEQDRNFRREERDIERAIRSKEAFSKRDDVKKVKERMANLNQIDDLLQEAPELAAGVIPFKIAKGIAGEVGNLTQAEREDAQISPSFYRKLQRGATTFLTGRIPEADKKELEKVVKLLKAKEKSRLAGQIENFSKSRSKSFSGKIKEEFKKDLLIEYGLDEEEKKSDEAPKLDTATQLEIIRRIKAKRGMR